MITPLTFKTRFPEFDSKSNETIQMLIDEASLIIFNFGDLQDIAMNYLVAHLLTLNGKSTASQQVSSKNVGSVSVSFATDSDSSSFYASTSYGQMYLDLRKRLSKGNVRVI